MTAVILLSFLWFTELHSILYKFYPKQMDKICDLFIEPGYHRKDVSLEWFVKMFFDDFIQIIGFFMAGRYIQKSNERVGVIFKLLSFYFVIDLFLFIWNYKSNYESYWALLLITTIIIVFLLLPMKHTKPTGRIIDISDKYED